MKNNKQLSAMPPWVKLSIILAICIIIYLIFTWDSFIVEFREGWSRFGIEF